MTFDLHRAGRLNPAATMRPEPFGALVYRVGHSRGAAAVLVLLGRIAARAAT